MNISARARSATLRVHLLAFIRHIFSLFLFDPSNDNFHSMIVVIEAIRSIVFFVQITELFNDIVTIKKKIFPPHVDDT